MPLARLHKEITALLNRMIEVLLLGDNAKIASTDEPTAEVLKLENEIADVMDTVQAMILRCAETKYAAYSGVSTEVVDRMGLAEKLPPKTSEKHSRTTETKLVMVTQKP